MRSPVITGSAAQLTLSFEPGLTERYKSLRECVATGIYQRGLTNVAGDIDEAPGNLSVQLAANHKDHTRHFSVDSLEKYIETNRDLTPIYYLVEKFLKAPDTRQNAALASLPTLLAQVQQVMKAAGVA